MNKEFRFTPNIYADIKYVLLDMFETGKLEVSTSDVYNFLRNQFPSGAFTLSGINDILCHLCDSGEIDQVKTDAYEYVWKKKENEEVKSNEKKNKKKNNLKETTSPKEKQKEENASKNLKNAIKHKAETDKGDVIFYTIDPEKYDENSAKGYWVATSDEAYEMYLFEKDLSKKEVIALVMQLVDMDSEEGIEVKKNF